MLNRSLPLWRIVLVYLLGYAVLFGIVMISARGEMLRVINTSPDPIVWGYVTFPSGKTEIDVSEDGFRMDLFSHMGLGGAASGGFDTYLLVDEYSNFNFYQKATNDPAITIQSGLNSVFASESVGASFLLGLQFGFVMMVFAYGLAMLKKITSTGDREE